MSSVTPPSPIRDIDYDALEAALLQTAHGRWFLAEYVRRSQPAEFASLREALQKLEHAITTPVSPPAAAITPVSGPTSEVLRHDLIEMSEAISRTRREIAAIKPSDAEDSQLVSATGELDAIVAATEHATSGILEAAEDIQEVAWLLREKGIEEAACDRLDGRATEIYTSCSFQDITGQRIQKVVDVLRFLESRVVAMMGIWGLEELAVDLEMPSDDRPDAHLLNGPQLEGQGLDQGDIDDMIDATSFDTVSEKTEETAAAAEQPNHDVVSIIPVEDASAEVAPAMVAETTEVETAAALDEVGAADQADAGRIAGMVDELVAASAAVDAPVEPPTPRSPKSRQSQRPKLMLVRY